MVPLIALNRDIEEARAAVRNPARDAHRRHGTAGARACGHLDGAISDFSEAIQLNPGEAVPYCNRGIAKTQKGDPDGALSDFNRALQLKPDFAAAYFSRGRAKKAKGDRDGEISDYNQA